LRRRLRVSRENFSMIIAQLSLFKLSAGTLFSSFPSLPLSFPHGDTELHGGVENRRIAIDE
jgi:hypothetical protein